MLCSGGLLRRAPEKTLCKEHPQNKAKASFPGGASYSFSVLDVMMMVMGGLMITSKSHGGPTGDKRGANRGCPTGGQRGANGGPTGKPKG